MCACVCDGIHSAIHTFNSLYFLQSVHLCVCVCVCTALKYPPEPITSVLCHHSVCPWEKKRPDSLFYLVFLFFSPHTVVNDTFTQSYLFDMQIDPDLYNCFCTYFVPWLFLLFGIIIIMYTLFLHSNVRSLCAPLLVIQSKFYVVAVAAHISTCQSDEKYDTT